MMMAAMRRTKSAFELERCEDTNRKGAFKAPFFVSASADRHSESTLRMLKRTRP
jgi:hypothetical protein